MLRLFARLTIVATLLCVSTLSCPAEEPNAKNVLVIYSGYSRDHDTLDLVESTIRDHVPGQVNFSVAYLDYDQVANEAYEESLAEAFRRAYGGAKLDLVITFSYQALRFAEEHRDRIYPGVPIVFTFVAASRLEGKKIGPGITGLTVPVGIGETIDLALRLHPDTKAVAVISGAQNFWWSVTHSELLRYQGRVREIDLIGVPSSEMLKRVDALPAHTVVLFQIAAQDTSHPAIGPYDVLEAAADRLPTYSPWPAICFNHGCIGGVFPDVDGEAVLTGEIAARVLADERPESIPVLADSNLQTRVDWRELLRWRIPESALPPGAVVLYRQPTVWERDGRYIFPVIVLMLGQAVLIAGLLWQRARKRRAEAILRESEERFRRMADSTPSMIWMCDAQGRIIYLNDKWIAFTGASRESGYGYAWSTYVHPADVENVRDALSIAVRDREPFSLECRLRRRDGVYRWMFGVASPRVNGDGSFAGFIGSSVDTTDQKFAQHALEKVSGQLIEAQEKERSRIARELHDDICQRLALLSMELDQANRSPRGSPAAMSLGEIQKHCAEIASDVQSLSHQLHSSRLDHLGIVAAIRGFCSELSKQHGVRVTFAERDMPKRLAKDVSLCLFRVTQEALYNAVKYSGTKEFTVEISGTGNKVRLVVTDNGVGFDVEEAKKSRGLGLLSMSERVNLVHGSFSVASRPGGGTKVVAVAPLVAEIRGPSAEAGDDQVESVAV